ncbi:hypothetical protein Dsin_012838 [Dipteronia sinensis]|uniref:Endonuclease/exonuclease/phosphatase domain-containing protein n=1 Tax=Dipteronia sinensis TaxID=43782 RepID=A0AAE0AJ86_9ROSI|nr:hypothetical protein Dsin_012838 [Dipteronia sinensis]
MLALTWNVRGLGKGEKRKAVRRGDFNSILDPLERKWGTCNMGYVRNFISFTLKAKVVDLPMIGFSFTCSNNREQESWVRLDRFFISLHILSWFPRILQKGLPRGISDHNAVVIGEPSIDWGSCPFRFFNSWLEDKAMLLDALKGWKGCCVKGSKGFALFSKVKAAKNKLKTWYQAKKCKDTFLKDTEDKLAEVEKRAVVEELTTVLRKLRLELVSEMWKVFRFEEQK